MIPRGALITAAVLAGFGIAAGWYLEAGELDATVGSASLLYDAALYGTIVGFVGGSLLSFSARSILGKLQTVALTVLLCAVGGPLLAHYTNRAFGGGPERLALPVKQVTATWAARGLTREAPQAPPDGYLVFVETGEGTVRLFRSGGEKPQVGPTRSVEVLREPGYWGYPRYSLPPAP